ncbi:MAG TPA: contact-dependent growth inhibition system immunity protein [Planctomycetota bacterium]|nr:contact-dependent growth inhibition system immunity protein [Planctomycetota bacterium]
MSRRASDRYPRLRRLFAAYVNQDWDTMGPRPEDAVRRYAGEVSAADRAAAAREVTRLLAAARSEAALARALDDLRCGYAPEADGRTAREFLAAVRDALGTAPGAD